MNFKNIIVAAANKYKVYNQEGEFVGDIVLVDCGHMCRNMHSTIKVMMESGLTVKPDSKADDRGQGFINQNGEYFNRSEAYEVVKTSGQYFNKEYLLPENKLDSSCIRHFKEDVDWEGYTYKPPLMYCCMTNEMMGDCDCPDIAPKVWEGGS